MDKPKILIVGSFPSSKKKVFGGIAKSCEILIKSKNFSSFEILTFDSSQISNPPPNIIIRSLFAFFRLVNFPIKLIVEKPKCVIIFCSDGASALEKGLMICITKLYNKSAMIFPRAGNLINQTRESKLFLNVIKYLFKKADIFLAQSRRWEEFANQSLKIHSSKIKIIGNWTATNKHISIGESRIINSNNKNLTLIFVGWLEKEKGILEILSAIKNLNKKGICFFIKFIGDGNLRIEIEKFIIDNNLQDRISILGWIDSKEIMEHMKSSDIFILPSWQEGMPNALIEALACSLPSIVTSVGAIPDYLKNLESSLLIPPKNVAELEAAIEELINNHSLRKKLSKNGHLVAKSVFLTRRSLQYFSKTIMDLIN